jgi:hypothetical protein
MATCGETMSASNYTDAQHEEAEALRRDAANIEREIDALHETCAHLQREACLLHEGADKLVPIEHARKP